jgi:molybdenum cofactor guanylyltransferase
MPTSSQFSPEYSIDAGILAGGRGQRMGGQDKGLVRFDGKPMIRHVYDALAPHVREVWINCNRNQQSYRAISPYLCSDTTQDFSGPLAGLASILAASTADFIITSPCDTPCIGTDYCLRMLAVLAQSLGGRSTSDLPLVLVARCDEKVQPLHLCLSRQALHELTARVQHAELKVFAWLEAMQPIYVDFDEDDMQFRNLNRPEDLAH